MKSASFDVNPNQDTLTQLRFQYKTEERTKEGSTHIDRLNWTGERCVSGFNQDCHAPRGSGRA